MFCGAFVEKRVDFIFGRVYLSQTTKVFKNFSVVTVVIGIQLIFVFEKLKEELDLKNNREAMKNFKVSEEIGNTE